MSKTQAARDAVALMMDTARPVAERRAALATANDLRRELSVGWAKIGAPGDFSLVAFEEELETAAAAEAMKPQGDAEKPLDAEQPSAEKKDRGGIGRMVNVLLTETADDYASIVAKVKEAFPEAKTTARSVASVAADLRRSGVDVPTRRKAKAVATGA
jgi:hypothetical protein